METLLTKYNCQPCLLQFYTRHVSVQSDVNEYRLLLPEAGVQQVMLSPSTEEDTIFEGFNNLLSYGCEAPCERDLNEIVFSGFETIYLSPERLFDNVGIIIRKVSFSDSLTQFRTYGYTKARSNNGASLLEELDFSKCTKLRNIDQWGFLLGWNIKKVDLSNIGSDKPAEGEPDEVRMCGDSFSDLQYLRTLVFPNKICRLDLHESPTITNIGRKYYKGTNIILNNIFIDTKDKKSFDYQIPIIRNSKINNLFINEITTTDCSSLPLLENSEVESLHLSEKVVDNYEEHPFTILANSKINRIYVYSTSGKGKPTDWFKKMKSGIFVRWSPVPTLITEKVITNKTIEEAIQEVIDE